MIILGVTGRARSGKNSVAEALISAALDKNLSVRVYEISEYIIKELKSEGAIPKIASRESLTREQLKLLIDKGNSKRKTNPWHWIDQVFNDIVGEKPDIAILPNIRFVNEANAIKAYGHPGVIIRVKSLVRDGVEFVSPDRDPNDETETEQFSIQADYFLTTKRGETKLLSLQAKALFEYITRERYN